MSSLPTSIPGWLLPSIALLPALLWMFLGVGLPWTLTILPHRDWPDRVLVVASALALGPLFTTLAMLGIGTFGSFSIAAVLVVTGALAVVGSLLAWRKARRSPSTSVPRQRQTYESINFTEKLLIGVIVAAVLLRVWNTAYFPYTTYDELWVYGYNAQVFMLRGNIPVEMGYYPQMVPLSYTYAQLMWGSLDPHAARTVVPIYGMISILLTYLMGRAFGGRRVGLLAAAIWALYPHHGAWSQFGDLEVPVTAWFTGCAAFLLIGWQRREWRFGVLSGLLLGAGLWTKPTAGALIESLAIILVVIVLRDWRSWYARLVLIVLTVGAIPGGIWYVRNWLLGHDPIVLPMGYWQNAAQRSGQELGWLLLIAGGVTFSALLLRRRGWMAAAGMLFLLVGALPSAFGGRLPDAAQIGVMLMGQIPPEIVPSRLGVVEIILLSVGVALLLYASLPLWKRLSLQRQTALLLLAAFIAPYWITWFWSYSYHFRLSFAVVPLQIVLVAWLGEGILRRARAMNTLPAPSMRKVIVTTVVIVLSLPGLASILTGLEPALTGRLPTDDAKIAQGNPALMDLVMFIREQEKHTDHPLKIVAPGELRLPYFFPEDEINVDDYPLYLDEIADVDFFVDSSVGQRLYIEQDRYTGNQILASLTRENALRRIFTTDDGNFRFSVYTVHNDARFVVPQPNGKDDAVLGDFAHYLGYDLSTLENVPGQNIFLTLWWQAIKPADLNYSVFIHLWDEKNQRLIQAWGGQPVEGVFSIWQNVPGAQIKAAYRTTLWQAGEVVKDEWKLQIAPDVPSGDYELRIGLYEPISGARLPVTRDGVAAEEWVRINRFTVR